MIVIYRDDVLNDQTGELIRKATEEDKTSIPLWGMHVPVSNDSEDPVVTDTEDYES